MEKKVRIIERVPSGKLRSRAVEEFLGLWTVGHPGPARVIIEVFSTQEITSSVHPLRMFMFDRRTGLEIEKGRAHVSWSIIPEESVAEWDALVVDTREKFEAQKEWFLANYNDEVKKRKLALGKLAKMVKFPTKKQVSERIGFEIQEKS